MVEWDPVVRKVFLIDLFRSANQSEVSGGVGGRGVSATRVGYVVYIGLRFSDYKCYDPDYNVVW